MTQDNETIVREFYDARKNGDPDRLDETIDRLFSDSV